MTLPVGVADAGRLLESGLRYFPAATDNVIVLVPRHADMAPRTEEVARYLSGYGLARAYVLPSPPGEAWPVSPADLPLRDLLPDLEAEAPLLVGSHDLDGRVELSFVSGRYGSGRVPAPCRFRARDGAQLAYHAYPAASDQAVILVPGASAHGELYAPFARFLGHRDLASAYVLSLRGHHLSDGRRGDVDHVAQLEDDLADLIQLVRSQSSATRIVLAGHSMGSGLVLRFARGPYAGHVDGYMLLAPYLGPLAATTQSGGENGWVKVHKTRGLVLAALNAVGIRALNHGTLLEFDLPQAVRNGTEVLHYSYRMAAAMTPPLDYRRSLQQLSKPTLALVGTQDEMFEPSAFPRAFRHASAARLHLVEGASHLGLVFHPEAHRLCADWLARGLSS